MYFLYPQKATLCCTFIKNHKVINCRREKRRTLKANGEMRTEESAEGEELNDLSAYQRDREKKQRAQEVARNRGAQSLNGTLVGDYAA